MPRYDSNRVAVYHPPFRSRTDPQPDPTYAPVMCWPRSADCPSRLAIVGEGPGFDEDQAARSTKDEYGVPFVGRSGSELDRFLTTYGIDPDRCMITNIGRVFKFGNPDPTAVDIAQWEGILHDEINSADPLWIAAVGRISTRYFLGDVDMDTVHGIPYIVTIPWLHNGRGGRVVVIPVTHPAAGFYATEVQAVIAYDFAALDATIDGRLPPRDMATFDQFPNPDYRDLTDSVDDLETIEKSLLNWGSEKLGVAIDTEGLLGGSAWGLSYCVRPGQSFVIRRVHNKATRWFYKHLIKGINQGRLYVILHNSLHDLRVLRELGIPIPDRSFIDTMVLSYHLCVEPQGLKSLAFRHCGMEMDSYDEVMQDAQDRIAVEYYETIEGLVADGTLYTNPGIESYYFIVLQDGFEPIEVEFPTREEAQQGRKDMKKAGAIMGSQVRKLSTAPTGPISVGPFRYIEPYTVYERNKETGQLEARTKTPQQIDRRVKAALNDLRSGKITAAQLRKRWEGTDELVVEVVEEVIGPMREASMDDIPLPRAIHYAARDADATKRIEPILRARHRAMLLDKVSDIDHSIIPMVDDMQAAGIPIDKPYFEWLSADLAHRMIEVQDKIKAQFGVWINPNSGEQVADLLFRPVEEGGYGLIPTKHTKGRTDPETGKIVGRRGSTVDKVLEGLRNDHAIIPLIMEYRGYLKAKTSFVDVALRKAKWEQVAIEWDPATGLPTAWEWMWVVHCNFRITRVSSGRLSATGPNLLAVMGGKLGDEVRNGYVAGNEGDGFEFIEWDLSQIEMRVMASEANDEFLISMIMNSEDIHTGTANKMFKLGIERPYTDDKKASKEYRDPAKRTGFGVITGIQGPGLVDQMRLQGIIVTEEQATQWIADWLAACPAVPEYMYTCHREARAHGFVREWAGRLRYLPGIHSPFKHVRAEAGRQSHSHKIQAGAQSIMKIAMATINREVLPYWRERGKFIVPILQIHDALLLRIRGFNEQEIVELDGMIRGAMYAAAPPGFRVPLDAGMVRAPKWGLMKH